MREAVGRPLEHPQALECLGGHPVRRDQEAMPWMPAAADAPAELVELRQAEALGVLDDDHRRVGDVDADLDHRGRDEDVELAGLEAAHDGVLLVRLHPAVHEVERGARRAVRQPARAPSWSRRLSALFSDSSTSG